MCDPLSAGLALAGGASVAQTISGQQTGHAQKATLAQSGVDYNNYLSKSGANFDQNRDTQNAAFAKNQGTVADTLANYSAPNQQQQIDAAGAKREADYTSPLNSMSFAAPVSADSAPNSAVTSRNNQTAATAKAKSLSEAIAKAHLDAYGDARTNTSAHAASNAADISIADQAAANANKGAQVQQNVFDTTNDNNQKLVPLQMNADKAAGASMGQLGDALSAGSMLVSLGGAGFGGQATGMGTLGQLTGSNAAGYGGLFGAAAPTVHASSALNYVSPFA